MSEYIFTLTGWNRGGGRTREIRKYHEELVCSAQRDSYGNGSPNNATLAARHLLPRPRKNA